MPNPSQRALAGIVVAAALLLAPSLALADTSAEILDYPLDFVDWGFAPTQIVISPNNWVTWSNAGTESHSVVATEGAFNSGELYPSEGFSWFFSEPGLYAYFCDLHPNMVGTVEVLAE